MVLAAVLLASVGMTGCAGVELEGPGFEALGLTGNKKKGDPKVPERAPLVLPPNRARLPEPEPTVAAAPRENWPNDPDLVRKQEVKQAEIKKKEYIDHGDWSKNAGIDEFEKLSDPLERHEGGILDKAYSRASNQTNSETPGN